jgi:hypothetical protein
MAHLKRTSSFLVRGYMRRWHHVEPRKPAVPGLRGEEVRTAIAVAVDHPSRGKRIAMRYLRRTHNPIVAEKTGYCQSSRIRLLIAVLKGL